MGLTIHRPIPFDLCDNVVEKQTSSELVVIALRMLVSPNKKLLFVFWSSVKQQQFFVKRELDIVAFWQNKEKD